LSVSYFPFDNSFRGSYAGIHAAGFRDFLLKPELLRAITDCGFEHPSEVQQEGIPQALQGQDIICQAKSGMGKTAVFVLSILHQIDPEEGVLDSIVVCHTRELAFQICQEFNRMAKYLPAVKVNVFFGGIPLETHKTLILAERPNIVVGTPGRLKDLICRSKILNTDKVKRFVMDECDQLLESPEMRAQVQDIFKATPHEKQVMLYSATLSEAMRKTCRKFTNGGHEVLVDNEAKLTLHGLHQYYVVLEEQQKSRKLHDLLKKLEYNQVIIFTKDTKRCRALNSLLEEHNFPTICTYGGLDQTTRLERYNKFKEFKSRILVCTDMCARGVDFERVNIVINYDMTDKADTYLHRVGRSGRFGTKGLAISFLVTSDPKNQQDINVLEAIQGRFEVNIPVLPDEITKDSYMN